MTAQVRDNDMERLAAAGAAAAAIETAGPESGKQGKS